MSAADRKMLVLVVDDNSATRYSTLRLLSSKGFQCLEAPTGTAALECNQAIDAVILDVNLPDIDGFEVCRQLRARAGKSHLPIVFLSAERVEVNDTISGLYAGGDIYLTHPVDQAVLVATLAAQLRVREATKQFLEVEQQRHDDLEHTRDLFLGVLGHDLRTPLNVVAMSAESLIRDPRYSTEAAGVGRRIQRAAKTMSSMLDDLHDYASSKLGFDTRPKLGRVDLALLISGVVEDMKATHENHRIELISTEHVIGHWDGSRVARIVTNLLKNALQYGAPGEVVRITVREEANVAYASVHNWGPAIEASVLSTLFEPLRRTNSANSSNGHNLGLGLFICKRLAEAHGGSLHVTSSDQHGTCFELRLPKSHPDSNNDGPRREASGLF